MLGVNARRVVYIICYVFVYKYMYIAFFQILVRRFECRNYRDVLDTQSPKVHTLKKSEQGWRKHMHVKCSER